MSGYNQVTAGKMRLKLNSLRASLLDAEKISSIVDTKILMANDQAEKSTQEIKHVNKVRVIRESKSSLGGARVQSFRIYKYLKLLFLNCWKPKSVFNIIKFLSI